ncbi:hypothetical protein BDZ90DRAFT_258846 [Jaminaea rosea]|uniref:HAD-like protein n=1 Tax=Jaminaea rosea TaxID=1569628 RepID=A0A316V008_9BASI|nr:hypothetical protein BDZ90DRAFT_258846 [Jaminaea rosea]PWN28765.1 hypothetical protein BDZ90DRAFT_258846 [Jaminaea rosea]
MSLAHVDVLFFEVCGTVVDWQSTITSELKSTMKGAPHEDAKVQAQLLNHDWNAFARRWHDERRTQLEANPQLDTDQVSRSILESLIESTPHLSEAWRDDFVLTNLSFIWHQLHPYPDSHSGLLELRRQFKVGTLTREGRGGMALNVNLAKYADLSWDFVLATDVLNEGEGDQYLVRAMEVLGIDDPKGQGARRAALVSSRLSILEGAKRRGMSTVFVRRETGDPLPEKEGRPAYVDVVVDGLEELAQVAGGLPMA